ncbi:MAG: ribosome biogenesis GTP-binding protein YihA/YsxC [Bacillota bacterium]
MNLNNARYELTAVRPEQYPKSSIPEITFVGRSNVGKSSLINSLLNRKNLARVASKPGKTREINFYNIDDKLYFVDLPGYGYARVSKSIKATWGEVIETYLTTRKQLKLAIMLVDIRHSPSEDDRLMHQWLVNTDKPHLIVATKLDKIPRSKVKERLLDIRQTLKLDEGVSIIPFSSETKQGKDELLNEIKTHIGYEDT